MQQDKRGSSAGRQVADVHRLFFALWPDAAVREQLQATVRQLQRQHLGPGRWTRPERYHLTMLFLGTFSGQVPAPVLAAAEAAGAALQAPAFTLELDRCGSFLHRAITAWIGCAQVGDAAAALHEGLRQSVLQAGVALEQAAWTPHVTVLRDAERALPASAIAPITWPVREIVLIDSRQGAGSDYRVVARWPLR